MQFSKLKKRYRWGPVAFDSADILAMIERDPLLEFVASYHEKMYWIGVSSEYDDGREEFYNHVYYINDQEFSSFQEFKSQAMIDERLFADLDDQLEVIDTIEGNPKHYYRDLMDLKKRQMKNKH